MSSPSSGNLFEHADFSLAGVPVVEAKIQDLTSQLAKLNQMMSDLDTKMADIDTKVAAKKLKPKTADAQKARLAASRSRYETWANEIPDKLDANQHLLDNAHDIILQQKKDIDELAKRLYRANGQSMDMPTTRVMAEKYYRTPSLRNNLAAPYYIRETNMDIRAGLQQGASDSIGAANRDRISRSESQLSGDYASLDIGSLNGSIKNHDQRETNVRSQARQLNPGPERDALNQAADLLLAYKTESERLRGPATVAGGERKIHGKIMPDMDAALDGFKNGDLGFTMAKASRQGVRLNESVRRMTGDVGKYYGKRDTGIIMSPTKDLVNAKLTELGEWQKIDKAQNGLNKGEAISTAAVDFRDYSDKERGRGNIRSSDMLGSGAEQRFAALGKWVIGLKADIDKLPTGTKYDSIRAGLQKRYADLNQKAEGGYDWMQERADAKSQAKLQTGRDKITGKFDDKFFKIEDLKTKYQNEKTSGKTEDMIQTGKDIYKESLQMTKLTEALLAVERALRDEGDHAGADKVADKHLMGDVIGQQNLKDFKPMNDMPEGKLGEWIAKGMRSIPGIGPVAHGLFGSPIAKMINGTGAGKFVTGAARGLIGGDIAESAIAGGGAVGSGATAASGLMAFAASPPGMIITALAAAAAAAGGMAAHSMERNKSARSEEEKAYVIGTHIGSRSRLVEDVRDGKTRALDPRLNAMRYGASDYFDMADSINAPFLKDADRKKTVMTGLQLKRSYGVTDSQVGDLASAFAADKTVGTGGKSLNENMSQFAQVLETAVKNGMSSDEVSQAFVKNLDQTKSQAGGVLSQAQRNDSMGQLIAAMQSGDPRMRGQLGADKVQTFNNSLAGFQGKDTAYLATALRGQTAASLGYTGDQAKTVDQEMRDNPAVAMRYIANNQTSQVRRLMLSQMIKTSGGNSTRMENELESMGYGVSDALPASQSIAKQLKAGIRPEDVRTSLTDSIGGRYDKSLLSKDPLRENQKDNALGQVAQRQELNAQEIKIQSSRVTFESKLDQMNIQGVQSVYLGTLSGVNALDPTKVQNGNPDNGTDYTHMAARSANLPPMPTGTSQLGQKTLPGRDGGGSDSAGIGQVAGVYHGGEIVMNPAATQRFGPALRQMNGGGDPGDKDQQVQVLRAILTELRHQNMSSTVQNLPPLESSGGGIMGAMGRILMGAGGNIAHAGGSILGTIIGGAENLGHQAASALGFGKSSTTGMKLAQVGEGAVSANWAESVAGYCSRFIRQVFDHAAGPKMDALFGATAIETGNLWKKHNLTMTPDQAKASGGLQAGDTLFQMSGSGGAGHVGMVSADGKNVIENSTRGRGGKMITPIGKWGKPDLIGRLSLDTNGDLMGDGLPSAIANRTSAAAGGSLDSLIGAMGKAEGWGLKQVGGKWQMAHHNAATTAPFGLLGDSRAHPEIMQDPQLLHDFMVGKLTGKVLPSVAALGVKGFGSTVISGLVGKDGQVTQQGMSALQQRWAPVGAANDPRHLNDNWLGNVQAGMRASQRQSAATPAGRAEHAVQVVEFRGGITFNGTHDPKLTAAAQSAAAKKLREQGVRVKIAPAQSARNGS